MLKYKKRYRSGHNGTASKAGGRILRLVGSNPTLFAKEKRMFNKIMSLHKIIIETFYVKTKG